MASNTIRLLNLKNELAFIKPKNATERNRKKQLLNYLNSVESRVNEVQYSNKYANKNIVLDEIETQAKFVRKQIGNIGAKSLISNAEKYKSFNVGKKHAEEREYLIAREVKGSTERRQYINKPKIEKLSKSERYFKQQYGKQLTKNEVKFLMSLTEKTDRTGHAMGRSRSKLYSQSQLGNKKKIKDIIVTEFEHTFVEGYGAVFKYSGEEPIIKEKLDKLRELLEEDENFISNYASFEENFFNKVLPSLYEEVSRLRGKGENATIEEMGRALDNAIVEYKRISRNRTRQTRRNNVKVSSRKKG